MASIGAEDTDQDERLEAAGFRATTVEDFLGLSAVDRNAIEAKRRAFQTLLPLRKLDMPRDFWERWGELEARPMSEADANLVVSLRMDLEHMFEKGAP